MKVEKNIFNIQKAWIPITRITKITQNLQETMWVDGAFRKREYCIRQSYKYLNEHAIRISISTNHTSDISDKYDKINDHMHRNPIVQSTKQICDEASLSMNAQLI